MSKDIIRELKQNPQNFRFLQAQGRAEFWKNINLVARCTDHEQFEGSNQSATISNVIIGIVAFRICKSVLKYDCKTTWSSHIKRHAEKCKRRELCIFTKKK